MEMPCIDEKAVEEAIELYANDQRTDVHRYDFGSSIASRESDAAEKLGIPYVATYVLKAGRYHESEKRCIRIYTLKRTEQELTESLVPGGEISAEALLHAFKSDNAAAALKETGYGRLCDSMELGFTAFEKACDDYLTEYVKEAKYKTLTPEPVAAYILAKETEAKCVRIIMTCKLHNIDAETIKERVREAYV